MTIQELAEKLNGCQYREEGSKELFAKAKESNLVVVFGASDDLVILKGAIDDEIDAWDGVDFIVAKPDTEIPLEEDNTFYRTKNYEAIPIEDGSNAKNRLRALWASDEPDCSWLIMTELPHASFDVFEDDELYCRGLVFSLYELV